MTPSTLVRFAALILAGLLAVHAAVWGMTAMLTDVGEAPGLNWSAWWTIEGLWTSAMLQVRVGLTAALLGVGLRAVVSGVVYGATRMSWRVLIFCLGSASMIGAVVIEAVVLSSTGLGLSRTEINALLGSFAHNGLAIGSAVAVSQWIRYSAEQQFAINNGTSASGRQAR